MKKTSELKIGDKVLLPNAKANGAETLTVVGFGPFIPGPRETLSHSLGDDTIVYLRKEPTWFNRKGRLVEYACKATKVWVNQ